MLKTLGDQPHAVVEDEDARGAGELAGHVDQHGIAVLQRGDHAVAFDMHDPELRRTGLQLVADPRLAEVVGAAGRVAILSHHGTAAHRRTGCGMRDRHEGILGGLGEGGGALYLADTMDQPLAVHLQYASDIGQPVDAGPRGASAQDVIDEGAVDPGHLGDVGRCQAKLVRAGPQTVGQGVMFGHLFPKGLWIEWDMTGLNWDRQAARTKAKQIAWESRARMEIEKAYFTLPEVLARWSMPEVDLVYLAENDQLRLSVRILNLPIEFGDYEETDDGRCYSIPTERSLFNGLLDLYVQDVFQLFRKGEVSITRFRTAKADYACFYGSRESLTIRKLDLMLRREERDRFEAATGFGGASGMKPAGAFHASADYQSVRCNGCEFRLGPIQAQVVRILHAAAKRGDPWQSGKAVLSQAGSRSLKMADVFKSKKDWALLIESNGRGAYRLAGL